jgi:hypothetical protein
VTKAGKISPQRCNHGAACTPTRQVVALEERKHGGCGFFAVTEEGLERINPIQRRRYKNYFNLALFVCAAIIK